MADQAELEQLATAELQRLQRQHRTLELELRSLTKTKTQQLAKQAKIIESLQKEHDALKEQITLLEGGSHAKQDAKEEKHLLALQQQYADLERTIQKESTDLRELEGRIRKIQKEINVLRKEAQVPDSCYKETMQKVERNVVKLENRLDVVNKKCSDVLTENSRLRESINHMLRDRASFNEMWQTMVTQFEDGKKQIMDLIDQATLAFDQREELSQKLQVLKDRNENDKIVHIQEMREMQRRLEHDAKLHKFFDIKGQKRLNPELEQREQDKRAAQKEECEKQLADYKTLIDKMKFLYSETDANRLAAQYKRQEEENFALFSYVNELSHEVEVLHETTQQLADQIETQKAEQAEKEQKQRTEAADYLTAELERVDALANESKAKADEVTARLQERLQGIEKLFKLLQCADAPILHILSPKTTITEHNVKLFLGVIERRIDQLIAKKKEDQPSTSILAKKDRVPKFNVKEAGQGNTAGGG